jgi:release factor glutamine methyltransferase
VTTWAELRASVGDRLAAGLGLDAAAAATEARWMCEEAGGMGRGEWASAVTDVVGARPGATVERMVDRRLAGEPLAYVLGSWSFRGLELMVDARVLIPRPETEQVVEVALRWLRGRPAPALVADLGTGSGAIALSIATELPLGAADVWATDVSAAALAVCRANLAGAGRAAAQVRLAEGSWFEALPAELEGTLDLVVSNPPYVATGDELDDSVRRHEPPGALFAGADGLEAVRVLVHGAATWLRPGGCLVVEIGAGQGRAAAAAARDTGLVEVRVEPDLAGRDRILVAHRANPR